MFSDNIDNFTNNVDTILSEIENENLPMEEILKREIDRQKLIQQKLKEIEEQNRILAELEAKEKQLKMEDEVRKKRRKEQVSILLNLTLRQNKLWFLFLALVLCSVLIFGRKAHNNI